MGECRVLHLLPNLLRRGAAVTSTELFCELRRRGVNGKLFILFPGEDQVRIAGDEDVLVQPRKGWINAFRGLRSFIKEYKPDLIVAHGGEPLKYATFARRPYRRPRVIYRKIGLSDKWISKYRIPRIAFHRLLIRDADAIISIGESTATELVELFGAEPNRISIIHRGFRPERFSVPKNTRMDIRNELAIRSDAPVLINVGQLAWEKNQKALIRMVGVLRDQCPSIVLVLVGGGQEKTALREYSIELGVQEQVILTGVRSDVPELLAAADIFVLTSLTEGIPGALVEAGLAGLPSVSWNVAGVQEVVVNGQTGIVTPYGEEEKLVKAVEGLLRDPESAQQMGLSAQELCRERFAMEKCIVAYTTLFNDILGEIDKAE